MNFSEAFQKSEQESASIIQGENFEDQVLHGMALISKNFPDELEKTQNDLYSGLITPDIYFENMCGLVKKTKMMLLVENIERVLLKK